MHEYPFETYKVILKEAQHCSSFHFKRADRGGKTNVGFVLMDYNYSEVVTEHYTML